MRDGDARHRRHRPGAARRHRGDLRRGAAAGHVHRGARLSRWPAGRRGRCAAAARWRRHALHAAARHARRQDLEGGGDRARAHDPRCPAARRRRRAALRLHRRFPADARRRRRRVSVPHPRRARRGAAADGPSRPSRAGAGADRQAVEEMAATRDRDRGRGAPAERSRRGRRSGGGAACDAPPGPYRDGLHELHAGDSRGAPPRRRRAGAARRLGDRPGTPGALGMTAARELSLEDIEALAVGAWILGTGGGGSPYLGLLNMRRLYAEGHRVALMPPDALEDDDWVAAVSNMGAPLVGQERLTDSRTIARAVALMEEHRGVAFRAVMALEIGGGNSIQPLMAAAHLNKPVVDADMMGRAYPEAQMTSVAVGDLRPYPLTTVDCRGLESIVDKVPSWKWMERVSRKICVEYGSIASTCKAPRSGREVKDWAIHGTTTKAIAIGHAVREAQARHSDPVAAILSVEPGKVLFRGKVVDVDRRTTEGFLRGTARVAGIDDDRGSSVVLDFQNEWIVAWRDGEPAATSPDLICVLDSVAGEAVGTETIRYGQRVTVIALPPPPVFATEKGLAHVGPRAFGYDIDYRPVFG